MALHQRTQGKDAKVVLRTCLYKFAHQVKPWIADVHLVEHGYHEENLCIGCCHLEHVSQLAVGLVCFLVAFKFCQSTRLDVHGFGALMLC